MIELRKKLNEVINEHIGYYSYIQNNLAALVSAKIESIQDVIKETDMFIKTVDTEMEAKVNLFFFEQIATRILTQEDYLKSFKREDWITHALTAFTNNKSQIERFKEIQNILKQ